MARYANAMKETFVRNYFSTFWERAFLIAFSGTILFMLTACMLSARFGM